jgi:hypothetical protein
MNALTAPFRQLVDRKLWPLAILLIAALVAVPLLLAKDDAPVTPPAGVTGLASTAQAPTQPIVSLGEPGERESRRKVLGARKNPFEPTVKASEPKAAKSQATPTPDAAGGGDDGEKKAESDKPAEGGGAPAPAAGGEPTPVSSPAPPKKVYELYSLKIRFGSTEAPRLARRSIKRLTALPRMDEPTLVYLGLKKDLKTAVFLVDANTAVVGDGKCLPHPHDCQNLELKKGQTAFIDVLDDTGAMTQQYELDLVSIIRSKTADAEAAKTARTAIAKGGRRALRAKVSRINGWDFDPESGVLVEPGE